MIKDSECPAWVLMGQRALSLEDALVRFGGDIESAGLPADHPVVKKAGNLVGMLFDFREALTHHLVTPDEEMKKYGNRRLL